MLYREYRLTLRLTSPGRLLPWLGPALRGLVALRFKDRSCAQPVPDRWTRWERCAGCPHLAGCAYGSTFEPEPPAGVPVQRGREDAARPIVLAPHYPMPGEGQPGLTFPLRLTAVGEAATAHAPDLVRVLAESGEQAGLGGDLVGFTLADPEEDRLDRLAAETLPPHPDAVPGVLPRVGVGLTAPLFLTRTEGSRRQPVLCPTFDDLLRASLRSVSELFRLYGEPLTADFAALAEASRRVRLVEHCYEPFRQEHHSSRGRQRYGLEGVVGGGVYADVPLSLFAWLVWGGRLHVGGHRVAGAGCWRLVLD